jgi:hypothetical protein
MERKLHLLRLLDANSSSELVKEVAKNLYYQEQLTQRMITEGSLSLKAERRTCTELIT